MTRRGIVRLLLLAASLVASAVYLTGGSTLYARHRAPDGRGVLELRTPARWLAWRARDFETPVVARFVDADGTVSGSNAPIELAGNGTIYWTVDAVTIGSTARYDRRTRNWSIDP